MQKTGQANKLIKSMNYFELVASRYALSIIVNGL